MQLRETAKPSQVASDGYGRRKGTPVWVVGIALAALIVGIVGAGVLVEMRKPLSSTTAAVSPSPASAPPAASPLDTAESEHPATAPEPTPAPDRFADLMRRADAAFTQGRLAQPIGDNALDYYLTILAADPSYKAARDRLAIVVEALFTQAETALLDNSLDAAGGILEQVRRADPGSSRLAFLDTQLERAKADAAAAAAAETTRRQIATTVQPKEPLQQRDTKSAPTAAPAAAVAAPPATAPAPAAAPRPPSELDSLLSIEEARLSRGQLLEPPGDSALEYLKRATRLASDDERVRSAAARLGAALLSSARTALDDGRFDAADRAIAEARPLVGDSADLVALEQEVKAAQGAAIDRKHAAMLAAARDRLRSGALVDPADDSALYYLTALRADGYAGADVDTVRSELIGALSSTVRSALDKSDWAAADRALASLHRADPDSAATRALDRRLETGRLQQQYLATAVPASELKLLSYKKPVYPSDALTRGIEGWVELEYVVDRSGRTKDISVVAADPPGRFDKPAIAALMQYQYEPFRRDGQVYERRVRFRMNFALR